MSISQSLSRLRAALAGWRPFPRVVPEPRLAAVVAALGVLWLLPGRAGVVVAGVGIAVLVVTIAAEWVTLPGRGDLAIARELPGTIGLGDRVEGVYVVSSRWPAALVARLADDPPPAVRGGASEQTFTIPARGEARVPLAVVGTVRGRFALGPIGLRARTRLGLLAARFRVVPGDEVLVAPSVSGVRRFRLLALEHRLYAAGVRALRRRGEGRSFAGLREYAAGDEPRHIDWKATARRHKLVVREYSIEQSQTVFTLIDAGRSMTQLAGPWSRFEHALSAALVLTDVAATTGDRVGTLVFDDEVRAFVAARRGTGGSALRAVRSALVPVTATMTEPDYAAAFRYLAQHQRRRALIVFFTDVIDVRASRALLAYVARSAARHLVVVVALRNDELIEAAALGNGRGSGLEGPGLGVSRRRSGSRVPDPESRRSTAGSGLYRAAAAEELILAREEAMERMRRAGVTVLDVSPQSMAAAVVNRYLEIKARGAL